MLRDVFYYGKKPNVHPREKFAESLEDARSQSTTEHFWIISEFCDYRGFDWDFDFEFLPDEDVWAEEHNNVWPSQHQKDSGTWLCPKEHSDVIIYRSDVDPVKRRNLSNDCWVELDTVDHTKFDFSWHPDPSDPPYIYKWGCKYFPVQIKSVLEYHVPGAVNVKYMNTIVELLSNDCWVEVQEVDKSRFDMSWRPDPMDPPYIYKWGNKYIEGTLKSTLEYHAPGATDKKYMPEKIPVLPEWNKWEILYPIDMDSFDFSWRPDPREPTLNYVFGNNQYDSTKMPTIRYLMEGAIDEKHMPSSAKLLPQPNNFQHLEDSYGIDYSWVPDPTSPPYIYAWGNQWNSPEDKISIQYVVEGATEYKYMDERATRNPSLTNWTIPNNIDESSFDFSWHPHVEDQPYQYVFGTQHQKTGGPIYVTPGCHENSPVKYIDTSIIKATRLPNEQNFTVLRNLKIKDFDWSWHPDDTDESYIYVFGNQWHSAEIMPTIEYRMAGATQIKYVTDVIATLDNDMQYWEVPDNIDASKFDFSWKPNPGAPKYIYQFGSQWQKTGGPCYVMPNATEIKYVDDVKAIRHPSMKNWTIPDNVDMEGFDFSWHPDDTAPPYIYQFPTQWALTGGPMYTVPDGVTIKYEECQTAKVLPNRNNWEYNPDEIDAEAFDFSWHPYLDDQPYIYQFGTQWQKTGGPRYITPGATKSSPLKYIDTRIIKAIRKPDKSKWTITDPTVIGEFDYSWHPDDTNEPYIYIFGTQHQKTGGPMYIVPGATDNFYVGTPTAMRLPSKENWVIPDAINVDTFDFSWHPDELSPPYIYQFGTIENPEDGPRYVSPNTTGEIVKMERIEVDETVIADYPRYYVKTTIDDLVQEHNGEIFWALNSDLDYTTFDFSWRPTIEQAEYVHAFGSSDSELTQTYLINANMWLKGHREINWVVDEKLDDKTLFKLFKKSDMFYVDRGNVESLARFEVLKAKYPNMQKTRYLNSWVDTINRCSNRSTTELFWVLNSELEYTDFDFEYYPNPWQMKMVHVFGTQWSHWGSTFLVNRETFGEDTKWIKIIEHLSNLNFVKNIRATATQCVHDIVVIDHGNRETETVVELLKSKASNKNVATISYNESYLNTLRNIISKQHQKKEHYLWLCSSVCDYSNFDFSYTVDPFARDHLHVFPSGKLKFGDTFFIDVNKTREIIDDMQVLEDYHKVNYNGTIKTNRLPEPIIVTSDDTHVDVIKKIDGFPYATIITEDNASINVQDVEPMCLWTPENRNIIVTSTGATRITVPKEAKDHVKKELYDYPYIKRAPKLAMSRPMDIVYLSNGETGAEENWEHLLQATKNLKNRVVRVDGVNGRVAAYHAAVEASETPWCFTVFAKLKVSLKFDFNWQPDRMQVPKHYIFHARNPVNGLIYGHQALICYNKKLTLANVGNGLDFTLDDEHEVVPLLSGIAQYNTDPFSTWRTAFREVLKLKADDTDISRERLEAWLNKGQGEFSEYSIKGALDADEYYDEVNGEFDKLKLSYEWAWLRERFGQL